jgi:hypothetical protein
MSTAVVAQTAPRPQLHIEAARTLLDQITDASLPRNARDRMVQLRKLFGEMSEAYNVSKADWRTKFSAIESELTRIIGGGRGPGLESVSAGAGSGGMGAVVTDAPTAAPGGPPVAPPSGNAGVAIVNGPAVVGEIGIKNLDPAIREQLRQFRLEVELFFSAAISDSSGVSAATWPAVAPPTPR